MKVKSPFDPQVHPYSPHWHWYMAVEVRCNVKDRPEIVGGKACIAAGRPTCIGYCPTCNSAPQETTTKPDCPTCKGSGWVELE